MTQMDLSPPAPPPIQREFRAAWVSTVANIDWPSSRTLTVAQQRQELIRLLDTARDMRFNAVVLQVRPHCDALYDSSLEPWSEYLTGQAGRAPSPYYDPLALAITEAHKRGLHLHAWINPFRAWHTAAKSPIPANHVAKIHPTWVKRYGRTLWLDPGLPEVQRHTLSVVADIVKRYDVDGIHLDDYFYPYPETANGKPLPFPDDASFSAYTRRGGKLKRDDWRRDNVNRFIQQLTQTVRRTAPDVMVGVSPFGIWQPDPKLGIRGFNAYTQLYADARQWFRAGWVDYLSPQLYWSTTHKTAAYETMLDWWVAQNVKQRHLWPGNAAYRVAKGAFDAEELSRQVRLTRSKVPTTGNIMFSMKYFVNNTNNIRDVLGSQVYNTKAIIPASPWLDPHKPSAPKTVVQHLSDGRVQVRWTPQGSEPAFWWIVYAKDQSTGSWLYDIHTHDTRFRTLPANVTPSVVGVTSVDRLGNESTFTPITLSLAPTAPGVQAARHDSDAPTSVTNLSIHTPSPIHQATP